jgi:hypothetical protein
MDNFRQRLKELERNPLPDQWDEIQSRAGQSSAAPMRRRWIAGLVAAVIGISAIATAVIAFGSAGTDTPAVSEEPPTDNYTLEFLGFDGEPSDRQVAAEMRLSWAGTTFPGIRACTFRALDEGGAIVGRYTQQLANVNPDRPMDFVQEIPADGPAATVTGECGRRLDIGDPYAFNTGHPRISIRNDGGAEVFVQPKWLGSGVPGFVHCRVLLVDEEASVVGRRDVIEPDHIGEPTWWINFDRGDLDTDLRSYPLGVFPVFDCVPYVDGHEGFTAPPSAPLADAIHVDYTSPPGNGYIYSDVVFQQTFDGWSTRYTITWENGAFPGERECTVSILNQDGQVIGSDRGSFEAMPPSLHSSMETNERPASFSAVCGRRLDTPVAYVISDAQVTTRDGELGIDFTVEFPSDLAAGAYVGSNQCVAALVHSHEVLAVQGFTLGAPSGTRTRTRFGNPAHLDASVLATADPVIRCAPFEGQDSMARMVDDFVAEVEAG